jgi:hypothetical protein
MYFWKCWRDNRFRFIGCLITFAAIGILCTLLVFKMGSNPELAKNPMMWKGIPELWSRATQFVLGGYGSLITVIWALALGSASLGEEFQKGTAEFLLSRPRRRRYWVWVGWSAGVCEMAVTACVAWERLWEPWLGSAAMSTLGESWRRRFPSPSVEPWSTDWLIL